MNTFREISSADIPRLFEIRVRTDENALGFEDLERMGITERSVAQRLQATHKGWLCESDGVVVGFAMGDKSSGEMWVIAVLPEYCGRGIGTELLMRVESWLFACGCKKLWLTTDVDTKLRAYSFYRKHAWQDEAVREGLRYMQKFART